MKPDNLLTVGYLTKHPDNAARVIEKLPYKMTADLFARLTPDAYLPTFQKMLPSHAAGILNELQDTPQSNLIDALPNEQLPPLLSFCEDAKREQILLQLSPARRKKITRQMQFPKRSVGSIMMPPTQALPQDISVAEASKRVKKISNFRFSEVVTLDTELRYCGLVSLHKLITSAPNVKLRSIINYKIPSLPARKSLENLVENPLWTHVRLMPVTDIHGFLIGVLDYATLVKHCTLTPPEATSQHSKQFSALELLLQVPMALIEAMVARLFPLDTGRTTKGR